MHPMALRALDHRFAVELQLEREPALRDRVAVWYVPGDRVLVDAGGALTAGELIGWLRERPPVDAAFLGHWHEDHSGGASALAAAGIELHAGRATGRRLERPPAIPEYRARLWGGIERVRVRPIPAGGPLLAVPLPGHAPDQVGYLHEPTGVLFSGDLALRRDQRIGMPGEDPWASMASIRHALALWPDALATSHRGLLADYRPYLESQLAYLEDLADRILGARDRGLSVGAIVAELFGGEEPRPGGGGTWRDYSGGEFSTARWVRAFLARREASSRPSPARRASSARSRTRSVPGSAGR